MDARLLRTLLTVLLSVGLVVLLWRSPASAQSTIGLEARLSRLESENVVLRSQLNQLQSQISRLAPAAGITPPRSSTRPPTPQIRPGESALAEDPAFKRLATLVIELRERVDTLENQVNPGRR